MNIDARIPRFAVLILATASLFAPETLVAQAADRIVASLPSASSNARSALQKDGSDLVVVWCGDSQVYSAALLNAPDVPPITLHVADVPMPPFANVLVSRKRNEFLTACDGNAVVISSQTCDAKYVSPHGNEAIMGSSGLYAGLYRNRRWVVSRLEEGASPIDANPIRRAGYDRSGDEFIVVGFFGCRVNRSGSARTMPGTRPNVPTSDGDPWILPAADGNYLVLSGRRLYWPAIDVSWVYAQPATISAFAMHSKNDFMRVAATSTTLFIERWSFEPRMLKRISVHLDALPTELDLTVNPADGSSYILAALNGVVAWRVDSALNDIRGPYRISETTERSWHPAALVSGDSLYATWIGAPHVPIGIPQPSIVYLNTVATWDIKGPASRTDVEPSPAHALSCRVFPNPSVSATTLEIDTETQGELQWTLANMLGTVLARGRVEARGARTTADIPRGTLGPGLYVLTVTGDSRRWSGEVVWY